MNQGIANQQLNFLWLFILNVYPILNEIQRADVSVMVVYVFVADTTLCVLRLKFFIYVDMKGWEEELNLSGNTKL